MAHSSCNRKWRLSLESGSVSSLQLSVSRYPISHTDVTMVQRAELPATRKPLLGSSANGWCWGERLGAIRVVAAAIMLAGFALIALAN
jgi:hypothetical protein